MESIQFWQNFNLGTELQISGNFLFNGLHAFHTMERLDSTDEIFEVLYNLAVGFERLLKIQVALLEINKKTNLDEFEESLITHNHLALVARINKIQTLKFSTPHTELLNILGKFYKTYRYNRFQLSSINDSKPETNALINFFVKHLKLKLPNMTAVFTN